MIDDDCLNDLDDNYIIENEDDKLYEYYFPGQSGWDPHRLGIWDSYDTYRSPMISIYYENQNGKLYLKLLFTDDTYDLVNNITLHFNGDAPISIDIKPRPLTDFGEISDDGKWLPGTKDKCLAIIDSFWKLRAFL